MKRDGKIYKNYYDTRPTDKHILITGNFDDVICDDFQEYLENHHINFLSDEAEKRIDDYISILFYQMEIEEKEKNIIKNVIRKILVDMCNSLPF